MRFDPLTLCLTHSLTHPSPSPGGLGGAGGSPVAQSPRAAIDTLLVLVVILVAVRAPLAVGKVGATTLGYVRGEEDVLTREGAEGPSAQIARALTLNSTLIIVRVSKVRSCTQARVLVHLCVNESPITTNLLISKIGWNLTRLNLYVDLLGPWQ